MLVPELALPTPPAARGPGELFGHRRQGNVDLAAGGHQRRQCPCHRQPGSLGGIASGVVAAARSMVSTARASSTPSVPALHAKGASRWPIGWGFTYLYDPIGDVGVDQPGLDLGASPVVTASTDGAPTLKPPATQQKLYAAIKKDGGTQNMVDAMQTRAELYATIGYHDYEALDASIVTTIIPQAMPQRT